MKLCDHVLVVASCEIIYLYYSFVSISKDGGVRNFIRRNRWRGDKLCKRTLKCERVSRRGVSTTQTSKPPAPGEEPRWPRTAWATWRRGPERGVSRGSSTSSRRGRSSSLSAWRRGVLLGQSNTLSLQRYNTVVRQKETTKYSAFKHTRFQLISTNERYNVILVQRSKWSLFNETRDYRSTKNSFNSVLTKFIWSSFRLIHSHIILVTIHK